MTEQDGFDEAVLLFDADQSGIVQEMHFAEFEELLGGSVELDQFAASVVSAGFVVVGAALAVQGICFFTFNVDEEGLLDSNFNLPLRYLVDNAGPGIDLGSGPIRLACRGQCPVPWHAVHLWEPDSSTEDGSIQLVQKAIWRNRLGLKPTGTIERILVDDPAVDDARETQRKLETRLSETFGEEGKVNLPGIIRQHNDRLTEVSDRYRSNLEQQQQGYLDQIKNCRSEILQLKAALRHEQQRSRRLQQLLRGDP